MTDAKNPGVLIGINVPAVLRALRKGTTYERIAKRHRCSIALVFNIARVHGAPARQQVIDQGRVDAIVAACRTGEKYAAIAKRFGVSFTSVQRLAAKVGIRRSGKPIPGYLIEQAFTGGRTARSIAAELGVGVRSVCRRLRERGLSLVRIKATDQQIRACFLAGLTANASAKRLGVRPTGSWYRRWYALTDAKQVSA